MHFLRQLPRFHCLRPTLKSFTKPFPCFARWGCPCLTKWMMMVIIAIGLDDLRSSMCKIQLLEFQEGWLSTGFICIRIEWADSEVLMQLPVTVSSTKRQCELHVCRFQNSPAT